MSGPTVADVRFLLDRLAAERERGNGLAVDLAAAVVRAENAEGDREKVDDERLDATIWAQRAEAEIEALHEQAQRHGLCLHSGLLVAECQRGICDCFFVPDESDPT